MRRPNAVDQERWRDSRRNRMTGYGALGDSTGTNYPYVPIPEWMLDCCTVACEVKVPPRELPDNAVTDHTDSGQMLAVVGSDGLTLRLSELVDLARLLIEPRAQVAVTEVLITIERESISGHHHMWVVPGFLKRYMTLRWHMPEQDVPVVRSAWSKVVGGPNASEIRVPLRRLGLAGERPFDDERLVDLWVGLDAFFKGEDETRAGQKTAQRAGRLLNPGREERTKLNRTIDRSYRIRSSVIHGRDEYTEEEVVEAAGVADDLLRRVLRHVIDSDSRIDFEALRRQLEEPTGKDPMSAA